MLPASAEFLAESMRDGNQPVMYLDIWPDKGPQRRLTSSSDWSGVNDTVVGLDSNVSATRKPGSLMLGTGSPAPITGSGFTGLVAHRLDYQINVSAHWHTAGNNFSGHYSVHDYFSSVVVTQDAPLLLPFLSTGTFLMDSIRLVANNSGNAATAVTVRVVDMQGNQIGKLGSTAIAAASGQVTLDITGLSASLRKGGSYRIEFGYALPAAPGVFWTVNHPYTVVLDVLSYTVTSYTHTIDLGGSGFVIGGDNGYQATGSAVRTLDVLAVPVGDGNVTFSDVVPGGVDPTSMTITLYYTDSAVVAVEPTLTNWTLHGVAGSGDTVPSHQYWRAKIDMTANALLDETPELSELTISYIGDPQTFGTRMETAQIVGSPGRYQVSVQPGLDSVSTATAQMTPKPSKSMVGRVSVTLLPEAAVNALMQSKLRGRPMRLRSGYAALTETIEFYVGIVRDMAWSRGKYTLTGQDTIELVDVQVPRTKVGGAWSSTKEYAVDNFVIYGTNAWRAQVKVLTGLVNPTTEGADGDYYVNSASSTMFGPKALGVWPTGTAGITPNLYPSAWQDSGTVWVDIGYTAETNGNVEWHLADIARDLITNRINIQSQYVDFVSLDAMKTRWPQRTGSRTLTKPVKAFEMLSEIAWLLEAQWSIREGQLSLIPETLPTDLPREAVTQDDVAAGASYRRGWAELKNESLILTGYSGQGTDNAQFSGGEAVVDVTSISDYDMVGLDVFNDKWNVPTLDKPAVSTAWSSGLSITLDEWVTHNNLTYQCTSAHTSAPTTEPGVGSTWSTAYRSDELQAISLNFVNRWKNGRRIIPTAKVQMRLLRMEPGDVVTFDSLELPPGDRGPYKMMVLKKDMAWAKQTLSMSFIEVQ